MKIPHVNITLEKVSKYRDTKLKKRAFHSPEVVDGAEVATVPNVERGVEDVRLLQLLQLPSGVVQSVGQTEGNTFNYSSGTRWTMKKWD